MADAPKAGGNIARKGHVPDCVLAELKRLHKMSSAIGGATPLDDPKRAAGDEFCILALLAIEKYDISAGQLSLALGLSYNNIRLKLSRRGYAKSMPSQPDYQGALVTGGGRKEQEFCRRGHSMSGDNLRVDKLQRRCRTCELERRRARYAAKKAASRG